MQIITIILILLLVPLPVKAVTTQADQGTIQW